MAAPDLFADVRRSHSHTRAPQLRAWTDDDEIVVDSFAGGGGASLGIELATGRAPHVAINHDHEAIALHAANHPESRHYNEDVWHVDPVEACNGKPVGLMWLSPDCKHFSKAKGGKPVSKRVRGLAWVAVRWAKAVKPRIIILENVEEFQDWGPLFAANHPVKKLRNMPDPARKGLTFKRFVGRLRNLGYDVEWRQLRASHFDTPTIRKRLFLIARSDGQPIVWPEPTHGPAMSLKLAFRTAAECIDWTIECPSIFERDKQLAENTLRRIARGIQKFVINNPQPFIVPMTHQNTPVGVDVPMPTITTQGNKLNLVTPIIAGVGGRAGQSPERSLEQPLATITSKGDVALIAPHITKFRTGSSGADIQAPMPTVTANSFEKRPGGAAPLGLASAYLVPTAHHCDERAHGIEEPLRTIDGHRGNAAIITPILSSYHGLRDGTDQDGRAGPIDELLPTQEQPLGTVLGSNEFGLVVPFLRPRYGERAGQAPRVRSIEPLLPTVVPTANGADLVATFLAKHNGNDTGHDATGQPADEPVHTLSAKNSKALVTAHLQRDMGQSIGAPADEPVPTITPGGGGKVGLVTAHMARLEPASRRHDLAGGYPHAHGDGRRHAHRRGSRLPVGLLRHASADRRPPRAHADDCQQGTVRPRHRAWRRVSDRRHRDADAATARVVSRAGFPRHLSHRDHAPRQAAVENGPGPHVWELGLPSAREGDCRGQLSASARQGGIGVSWSDAADRVLARLFAVGEPAPTREAIKAAYPFGMRKYHPYKVWLKRVRAWRAAHAVGMASPHTIGGRPINARQAKLLRHDRQTGDLF